MGVRDEGPLFNHHTFTHEGHAFVLRVQTLADNAEMPSRGVREDWTVDVDGARVGAFPAGHSDSVVSVANTARAIWSRHVAERR